MKKVGICFLVLVFVLGLVNLVLAQIEEKRAELSRVEAYIKQLDVKIKQAQQAKQTQKVKELRGLRDAELKRAQALRDEIVRLQRTARAEIKPGEKAGIEIDGGYGGGAGILSVGYRFPLGGINVLPMVGYGIGNRYSIIVADISAVLPLDVNFVGGGVCIANYSERVTDILGLSQVVDKGSKIGFGLFVGREFGSILAKFGYNTALGITVGVGYKF